MMWATVIANVAIVMDGLDCVASVGARANGSCIAAANVRQVIGLPTSIHASFVEKVGEMASSSSGMGA